MRVALVHDWLTGMRGGERVLEELALLYPDAEIYTLVHAAGSTSGTIERLPIHASPLSRVPGAARHYRLLLPLFPWAIERLDLSGYDLVISCSHAVAKGVVVAPGATHLCYCLTPMRYVWDQADAYLGRGALRLLAAPLVARLRRFDLRTSSAERVHRFVAISSAVSERIADHYARKAAVVHPPVATERFRPSGGAPEDYYLLVGGFVPYKREDIAVAAFRAMPDRRLVVVGEGPGRRRVEARASANVHFEGRVSDAALARLYAGCRALLYPQEEDFGIAAVEAQAAGRPVIAFDRGGAVDTVRPGKTGVLFDAQSPEAISDAIERFERVEGDFEPAAIRAWAQRFGVERFRRAFREQVDLALAEGRPASG